MAKKIIFSIISQLKIYIYKILYGNNLNICKMQLKLHRNTELIIRKNGKCKIGKNLNTESNVQLAAVFGGVLDIGENVYINSNCIFVSRKLIEIGNNTIFGPNVSIFDHNHKFDKNGKKEGYKSKKIRIGKNCWIGSGAIILSGANIGDNSIIGAGCVIKGHIPPNTIVKTKENFIIENLK